MMACEYCTDLDNPPTPIDNQGLLMAQNNSGEPHLIAYYYDGNDLVYFGTKANYCIKCGERFGDI